MEREEIGPYRILRAIGKGGMATVYEAVREEIERRVAIKVLHREFAMNTEHAERFLNEARAVNRICHPSIVRIDEFGRLPDGTTYLVMELLVGDTVGQRLKSRGGRLAFDEATAIAKDVADALCAVHAKGIVHRDLKPDNIILVAEPVAARGERAKLLDFGIAKLAVAKGGTGTPSGGTLVGSVMGTLWYMSPEQVRDTAQVDAQTDVYALGIVLYQLFSGQVPFFAGSEAELMAAHLRDTPRDLREVVPNLPVSLASLVGRMLAKDPAARPQMQEVVLELGGVLQALASYSSGALPVSAAPVSSPAGQRLATPLTIANPRQPLSARSPVVDAVGERSALSEMERPSTLSGTASERHVSSMARMQRRRVAALSVVLGAALATVILVVVIRRGPRPSARHKDEHGQSAANRPSEAPAALKQAGVSQGRAPQEVQAPPTAPVAALMAPNDATPGSASAYSGAVVSGSAGLSTSAPATDSAMAATDRGKPPHRAPSCKPAKLTGACIQGSMAPALASNIADSLSKVGIQLCSNEQIHLVRNGGGYLFEGARRQVSEKRRNEFNTLLLGAFMGKPMPKNITIQCIEQKGRGK